MATATGRVKRAYAVPGPRHSACLKIISSISIGTNPNTAGGTASVEAIPKEAFPRVLADAVARNQLPDIIASNNWRLIRKEFKRHRLWSRMVKVHSVLAPLATEGGLKSGLGWLGQPYLDRQSDKFELMRQVMLQIPEGCPDSWSGVYGVDAQELAPLVKEMAASYVARDIGTLSRYRDPDALSFPDDGDRAETDARIHGVVVCSLFGNDRLAFSRTVTVYEKPSALGHQTWLLVVRRNGVRGTPSSVKGACPAHAGCGMVGARKPWCRRSSGVEHALGKRVCKLRTQ